MVDRHSSGKIETIRQLTISEWRDLIVEEIDAALNRKSKNCLNCMFFVNDTQICSLAGVVPPPRIAVNACEKWDEEIPF